LFESHSDTALLAEAIASKTIARLDPNFYYAMGAISLAKGTEWGMRRVTKFWSQEHQTHTSYLHIWVNRYHSFTPMKLSDGTEIKAGDKLGIIEFDRNIPTMNENDDLTVFTRQTMWLAALSLGGLAHMCLNDDPHLRGVQVFCGASRIAKMATYFGFDVKEMKDSRLKSKVAQQSRKVTEAVAGSNIAWQKQSKKNYHRVYQASISRDKLVRLFGKGESPILQAAQRRTSI
jgi:hypothetical protein